MADAVFPTNLWEKQDSSYFTVAQEDNAIKGETDGGYVDARPRHTRKPRKTFTTGWTDLDHASYLEAIAFYDLCGTWKVFTWKDPTTSITYRVRFSKAPTWTYVGMGLAKLWKASVTLNEV